MRRISLIVALLLLAAPSIGTAGNRDTRTRSLLVEESALRGPVIVRAAPPTAHPHPPHRSSHHRLTPGFLAPADVVLVPINEGVEERDAEPAATEEPPVTPVAEPKMLLPPSASQPDPAGARTIVIQRGDQIEVVKVPPTGRP